MRRLKQISSDSYISLVCYMLIGKSVRKIKLKSLHNLCFRIQEYYNKKNITYCKNALLFYIDQYKSNNNNYQPKQLFSYINEEIIFKDDINYILQALSAKFAIIDKEEFFNLYEHINTFIGMYQLCEDIEINPDLM